VKSRTLTYITAMTLFGALAVPGLAAQHTRYKLVDVGTFGGPSAFVSSSDGGFEFAAMLNNRGSVVGGADTSMTDSSPTPILPFDFIAHGFQWRKGALTDLRTLPGGNNSEAVSISANGLIAGLSENGLVDPLLGFLEVNAVLWKDGEIINLGTLEGGHESAAFSVNSRGQVVGAFFNSIPDAFEFGFQEKAFLWQNGVMEDLGTLGGPNARGDYINERGQVAGHSDVTVATNLNTGLRTNHAFIWENGTMLDLGTLGGTLSGEAALNNRGQVAGGSNLPGDVGCPDSCLTHPFLWHHGQLTDLGTLGGDSATAFWLNDAGEVVGPSLTLGDQAVHSFLWKNAAMVDLGTVGDDLCSFASSINSQGQIVGLSNNCQGDLHAFLWEKAGHMIDLNTRIARDFGVNLVNAYYINDRGEIVANGILPNGDSHIFLLIPCAVGHDSTQACEDSGGDTSKSPSVAAPSSTSEFHVRLTSKQMVAAFHAQLAHRNRSFGFWPRR
jgi:probable HAF family extracellular repeat protein